MEVGIDAPTAWSISIGVAAFFAAWAGKHLLDATALPVIKDWWARRSSRKAKDRAEWLAASYRLERRIVASPRYLLLNLQRDQSFRLGLYIYNVAYGIAGLIVWLEFDFGGHKVFAVPTLALLFSVCVWLYMRSVSKSYRKYREMLRNPKTYRRTTVTRLRSLLTASGMNAAEIKAWMDEKVPPLAEPITRLNLIKRVELGRVRSVDVTKENKNNAGNVEDEKIK